MNDFVKVVDPQVELQLRIDRLINDIILQENTLRSI